MAGDGPGVSRGRGELLITADGGGSNGPRSRLWKVALQGLADELGLPLRVCHFPPGTSKWNKIEHRLFCHITQNWRGSPLVSREAIVSLIGSTTTTTGLTVRAALDTGPYETGIKVSDEELAHVKLTPHEFHGEWNYTIKAWKTTSNCSVIDARTLSVSARGGMYGPWPKKVWSWSGVTFSETRRCESSGHGRSVIR